jgi:outer membrane protein assembly factor BamB
VKIGSEAVYVGMQNGDVLSLSKTNGSASIHSSYEEGVTQIARTEELLLIGTFHGVIHAYDDDGTERWCSERGFSFGPVLEDRMFVTAGNEVSAISLTDGSREWSAELTATKMRVDRSSEDQEKKVEKEYTSPPKGPLAVTDTHVIVPTQNGLFCLNQNNGEIEWRFDGEEDTNRSKFNSVQVDNGTAIALGPDAMIYCVDVNTGEQLTTYALGGETQRLVSLNSSIIATSGDELLRLDNFPEN